MSNHPSSVSGVFVKPKRPVEFHRPGLQARGLDMPSGKQRKYLQLKEKIMRTDELIQKYRQKAGECEQYKQQLKEVQTKLSIEKKGRKGLVAELSVVHQESKALQLEKNVALAEIERLQLNVKEEEMVKEQLMVQLGELKGHKETSGQLKEELSTTKSEMEKYKRMYQKLKQEFEAYKTAQRLVGRRRRRRTSEANSLPTPIISPPLSEAVLSPLSTCSLPFPLSSLASNSLATILPIKEEQNSIATQQLSVSGFDPSIDLSMDAGSKINLLHSGSSCETEIQEKSGTGVDIIIVENDDIIGNADSKTNQSRAHVKITHLSDDSDSDTSEDDEQTDCKIPPPALKKQNGVDKWVPNNDGKITLRDQSDRNGSLEITRLTITTSCPLNGIKLNQESGLGDGSGLEGQTSLSQELFGDFDDNLSHLSVSDSSSCCSQSSLGSVDDLADLLRSDVQLDKKDDDNVQDNGDRSDVNNEDGGTLREGANGDDIVVQDGVAGKDPEKKVERTLCINQGNESTCLEDDGISAQTEDLNHENMSSPSCGSDDREELKLTNLATQTTSAAVDHRKSDTVQLRNQSQTPPVTIVISDVETSVSSSLLSAATTVCECPTVFLPKIEVEAAPADTASSEDSDCEMDVSFSTLFGDEFQAISPLPPSPFSSHVCRCPSTPLSPLPPSPVEREPLSPLPQTPHKDLKSISPLPPSPINAHPAAISPIPATPTSLNRAHHEVRSVDSISPEELRRDSDTSPVQFDDAAPINVHVPKPCSLSITIHASSESSNLNDVIISPITIGRTDSPSPKKRKLCVSETSPFSPLTFILPSSVETSSVFDSTPTTVSSDVVPSASEASPSSPLVLRPLSTSAEVVSFDRAPTTTCMAAGAVSGTCTSTCKASPTSPTRPLPAPVEAVTVPVFEAVPLTKTVAVAAREAAVATSTDKSSELTNVTVTVDSKAGEAILLPDGLKEKGRFDDMPKGEADHSNKSVELVNGFKTEGKLGSGMTEDAISNSIDVGELAGRTMLQAAVADDQGKPDEGRTKLSLQVVETEEENPSNLTIDSFKLDSSNIHQGIRSDELMMVDQATRSTKLPNIKSEKRDESTVVELFGDSDEPDFDLPDDNKLISDAAPLSDGDCTSKSPVEEGEIEDSDEEGEREEEEKLKLIPSVKNGWNNNDQYSPQQQVAGLPVVMLSQQKRIAETSLQSGFHATHLQIPPPAINRTSIATNRTNKRNLQGASNPMTATTFNDLLNTFCTKTRSGKRLAMSKAVAKTKLVHGSSEKPTPLARLLSAARNKPKKKTNQATKTNAASFIGVQSVSSANPTNSLTGCSERVNSLTITEDQKDDGQRESRVGGQGKRSVVKRLEKVVSTEELACKRPKLECVVSSDCSLPEHGASNEEEEAREVGAQISPLEATSSQHLPGYQLRTRNVLKFQPWPKRKRRTSGACSGSGGGREELEQPTRKKRKGTSGVTCGSPEAKKTTVKPEIDGGNVKEEEHVTLVSSKQSSLSLISNKDSSTENSFLESPSLPSDDTLTENMSQEQTSKNNQLPKPIKPHCEAAASDTVLSSSAPPTATSSQPTTTSILADSCHLDTSSDAGDSDQPLMIGDLESLLDGEEYENGDATSPLLSLLPQSQQSSLSLDSQSVRSKKPHVRKTDSATGQEEDQTPANSPKTGSTDTISKQLQALSEQKASATSSSVCAQVPPSFPNQIAPPSLATTCTANTSTGVGYGQPQQTPLPEYKPKSLTNTAPQSSKDVGLSSSLTDIDDDDVFSTPLPLLEKSTKATQQLTTQSSSSATVTQPSVAGECDGHPGISIAQQALTLCMKSPLPLPHWLVAAMTRVQSKHEHCSASGAGLSKKKKKGNAKEPIMRQRKQKIMDYVMINLERLVCGHLHLSTVLTMFANQHNVPSLEDFVNSTMRYLLTRYNPKIEHVVSVFHTLCDDVRGNPQDMCPLDGGFPPALLRPECQLVALFLQMSQLYPSTMAPLLVEMNKALYQTMLKPSLKFHKLSALGRILTAICRLQGDADRVLFLTFDLLKKPLTINELPVMAGLASVWPNPLARRRGVKLVDNRTVVLKGLEQQPLSYTLEVLVTSMMQSSESKAHGNLPANLHTLCQWGRGSDTKIPLLTNSLIKLLQTSDGVYIVSPQPAAGKATGSTPWHRPRPSVLAFHIVHCLRAIAHYQGWVWTNDTLIRGHLWPLLQQWNANQEAVREATVVCAVRLIGFISQQGLTHDPASSSVGQLQRVFIALLNKPDQISFPVQLAAVDSLLELCPPTHPRMQEVMGVVKAWLKRQSGKPHGVALCNEFGSRLQL